MAIYDTMQSLNSSVATHCVGFAYNLAAFLLAAGEKVPYFSPSDEMRGKKCLSIMSYLE